MKIRLILAAFAALSQPAVADSTMPREVDSNPSQASAVVSTTAHASGTLQAVDRETGELTIAHGPVPALKWPAMTMDFEAPPEQLQELKVGDRVQFAFSVEDMSRILHIQPES